MKAIVIFVALLPLFQALSLPRDDPLPTDPAKLARWIVHNSNWASMATKSTREPTVGFPFSNPWDISDGSTMDEATGVPYFYMTDMEMSVQDLVADNKMSLSVTLDQGTYCHDQGLDAQDPPCGRVILTGSYTRLEDNTEEYEFAKASLFARHPGMEYWPADHGFFFARMNVEYITLLAGFGGANLVSVEDYFAASLADY